MLEHAFFSRSAPLITLRRELAEALCRGVALCREPRGESIPQPLATQPRERFVWVRRCYARERHRVPSLALTQPGYRSPVFYPAISRISISLTFTTSPKRKVHSMAAAFDGKSTMA